MSGDPTTSLASYTRRETTVVNGFCCPSSSVTELRTENLFVCIHGRTRCQSCPVWPPSNVILDRTSLGGQVGERSVSITADVDSTGFPTETETACWLAWADSCRLGQPGTPTDYTDRTAYFTWVTCWPKVTSDDSISPTRLLISFIIFNIIFRSSSYSLQL